jgi:hypothetical protein
MGSDGFHYDVRGVHLANSDTHLTGPSPVGIVTVPILAVLDGLLGRDERSLEVILVYRSQFLTTRLPRSSAH